MKDYGEICILIRKELRDAYELANQGNTEEALLAAKTLNHLSEMLVRALEK